MNIAITFVLVTVEKYLIITLPSIGVRLEAGLHLDLGLLGGLGEGLVRGLTLLAHFKDGPKVSSTCEGAAAE